MTKYQIAWMIAFYGVACIIFGLFVGNIFPVNRIQPPATATSIIQVPSDQWEAAFAAGTGSRERQWLSALSNATITLSVVAGEDYVITAYNFPRSGFPIPTSTASGQANWIVSGTTKTQQQFCDDAGMCQISPDCSPLYTGGEPCPTPLTPNPNGEYCKSGWGNGVAGLPQCAPTSTPCLGYGDCSLIPTQ